MRDTVQTNKIIIGTLVIGFVLMISGCKQGGVAKLNDQEEKVLEFFFAKLLKLFAFYRSLPQN